MVFTRRRPEQVREDRLQRIRPDLISIRQGMQLVTVVQHPVAEFSIRSFIGALCREERSFHGMTAVFASFLRQWVRSPQMQEANVAAIVAGVLSGLLGGGIAAWGAWYAVKTGVSDLEATERRRQKISCVINLYGLRYVLSPDPVQRDEDRTRFMFEIGRAGALCRRR